ncbi:MAG: hypothetical protein ACQEQ7_10450 [Thermodesulfobacteriota bacterium]
MTRLGHLADQLTTGIDFSTDQAAVAQATLRWGSKKPFLEKNRGRASS